MTGRAFTISNWPACVGHIHIQVLDCHRDKCDFQCFSDVTCKGTFSMIFPPKDLLFSSSLICTVKTKPVSRKLCHDIWNLLIRVMDTDFPLFSCHSELFSIHRPPVYVRLYIFKCISKEVVHFWMLANQHPSPQS